MESIVISVLGQAAYAVLAFFVGYFWRRSKKNREQQEIMGSSMRAVLKYDLREIYDRAEKLGYVSYADGELAEELYTSYAGWGGNGQGTAMIQHIRHMRRVRSYEEATGEDKHPDT